MKYLFALIILYLLLVPLFAFSLDITQQGQVNVSALVPAEEEAPAGGAGLPADLTSPKISEIAIENITQDSATISWKTDELTIPQINYGRTRDYEKTIIGKEFLMSHSIVLKNLLPDTLYHFEIIAADRAGNRKSSGDLIFKTLPKPDAEPPANVSGLEAFPGDGQILLQWKNPPDLDFAGIKIQRSRFNFPQGSTDGETMFEGMTESFTNTGLINGVRYFYTVFSFDKARNFSSGAIIFAVPQPPVEEIPKEVPPKELPPEEKPAEVMLPAIPPTEEIKPGEILPIPEIPLPTVKPEERRTIEKVILDIFKRKADFFIEEKEAVKIPPPPLHYLVRTELKLSLPVDFLPKKVKSVILLIKASPVQAYRLEFDEKSENFQTTIITPPKKGKYELNFIVEYQDGTKDVIKSEILLDPYGYVYRKIQNSKFKIQNSDYEEVRIEGARVTLFWLNNQNGQWETWQGQSYNQDNPQITDKTGEYAFLVPAGKYFLTVEKEGYFLEKTLPFEMKDLVVNLNIELTLEPYISTYFREALKKSLPAIILVILVGVAVYLFLRKRKKYLMSRPNVFKIIFIFFLFFLGTAFAFAQQETTTENSSPPVSEQQGAEGNNLQNEEFQENEFRIVFQGLLLDKEGKIVEDGNYHILFRIYDLPEDSQVLWEENFIGMEKLAVSQGRFQITLGRKQKLNLDFEKNNYWLGVTVGGKGEEPLWDEEMKPRKKIVSLEKLLEELAEKEKKGKEKILEEEKLIRELLEKIGESGDSVILIDVDTLKQILEKLSKRQQPFFQELFSLNEEGLLTENALTESGSLSEGIPSLSETQDEGFAILRFFRDAFIFIKEKILSIFEKISQIFDILTDLSQKVTAIYNVVVKKEEPGIAEIPSTEETSQSEKLESENQDSGSSIIFQGEISTKVMSEKVKEESKIFITFSEEPPYFWWISERVIGKYFIVSFDRAMDKDYTFDWWVLNSELIKEKKEESIEEEKTEEENLPPNSSTEPAESLNQENGIKKQSENEVINEESQKDEVSQEQKTQEISPQTQEPESQSSQPQPISTPEDTIKEGDQITY